jgi:hypothetical protein
MLPSKGRGLEEKMGGKNVPLAFPDMADIVSSWYECALSTRSMA